MALVTVKKLPQSQVEVSVSLPWEEWRKHLDRAVEHMARDTNVPGFRPGKAPRAIIETKYGKSALLQEAGEQALQASYPEALRREKLDPIGRPQAEIKKCVEGEALGYVVRTTVMPEATLGAWQENVKAINNQFIQEPAKVQEDEIEKELARLAESRAQLVTVRRGSQSGDSVEVDFQVSRDGVPIEKGTSRKHPLILGKGVFIPGFEEAVIGMQEGEEKEFTLTFPETYHQKHLAGQPATFKVKLLVVQERRIPAVDDTFARSLGKFENLKAFTKHLRGGLLEEKRIRAAEERRTKILDALVTVTVADVPELLRDEELQKMLHEFEQQIQMYNFDFNQYLEQMKKTKEDLLREWGPQAEKRIKSGLALETLAREREVEIVPEAVEAEMNKTIQYYKSAKDMEKKIDLERLYRYAKGKLENEAVFKYLESL